MNQTLTISGMSCEHCAHKVKTALEQINGVNLATVSVDSQTAIVELSEEVSQERLSTAVTDSGYTFVGVQ
jgi:copper ion binding protein